MIKVPASSSKQTSRIFKLVGLLLLVAFTCRFMVYAAMQKSGVNITAEAKTSSDADEDQNNDSLLGQPEFIIAYTDFFLAPHFINIKNTSLMLQSFSFSMQHYMPVLTPPPNC
jgi:hypothetical protein